MSTNRVSLEHQTQTTETDTTLVYAPDGSGGAAFVANAGVSTTDHTHIVGEPFTGDGSTTTFMLANEAQSDTVAAYDAGLRLAVTLGGMDDTITFGSAPTNGHAILVDYIPAL